MATSAQVFNPRCVIPMKENAYEKCEKFRAFRGAVGGTCHVLGGFVDGFSADDLDWFGRIPGGMLDGHVKRRQGYDI